MSIKSKQYVMQLLDKDNTSICAFCGKPVSTTMKQDREGHPRDWSHWLEYSCSCEKWQQYEQLYNKLLELDDAVQRARRDYKEEFLKIKRDYNLEINLIK